MALRREAAIHVSNRLRAIKKSMRTFGFHDMLERLDAALAGPTGAKLRERILQQYPVAMIDEFQDTSGLQFSLFDSLYNLSANDPSTAILLIGDPKQSIYSFRGADIQSYICARESTKGRHYNLTTNFRSTTAVVNSVNRLFKYGEVMQTAKAFKFNVIDGNGIENNPVPFIEIIAHGRDEILVNSLGEFPALTISNTTEMQAKDIALEYFAAHCAEHLVSSLNDPQTGFREKNSEFTRLRQADIAILVRNKVEAETMRKALRKRGVSSVYLSDKDSVFNSQEAKDVLRWLRAVAQPRDDRLARAAYATPILGLTLPEMANLATQDIVFEQRAELLLQLHSIWQRQGVLPMLRQALHRLDLPAMWLAEEGGERRLTNVLHLAESLQSASAKLEGEQALVRWFTDAVNDATDTDDAQIVRLESEADLVKVVTIHKAKGLEYPVVYLPFACSFRRANEKESFSESETENQSVDPEEERMQEDLRLLYVAMTRARHALWLGVASIKDGRSKKCGLSLSAMGHLLGASTDQQAEDIPQLLAAIFAKTPTVQITTASNEATVTRLQAIDTPAALQNVPVYTGRFERDWSISSFSALVRDIAPLATYRNALTESMEDEIDNLTADAVSIGIQNAPRHRFPRGSLPGKFLHEQLAWIAEQGFSLISNVELQQRLVQRCEHQGWGLHADEATVWFQEIVHAMLPPLGASLCDIKLFLPEMEFWFPVNVSSATAIDRLCTTHLLPGKPRPQLVARTLQGLMMGFADLVFFWKDKYWVLDYKSNFLGRSDSDYSAEALELAMIGHRYDVQATLYLLALHRLLKSRLGERYNPAQQLGGTINLFLRGIYGPASGCMMLPADLALLAAMDSAITQEKVAP
jgi:exodeoxyribonuclease V beta subunit